MRLPSSSLIPCWSFLLLLPGCSSTDPEGDDDTTVASDDDNTTADDDDSWQPELACPGDPDCLTAGDGVLKVGAGLALITPEAYETWSDVNGNFEYSRNDGDTWNDCGQDRLCPSSCDYGGGSVTVYEESPGYSGPDPDGTECDNLFQAIWMAGFQTGRAMNGVHDDLHARAIVLEQGDMRLGLVALDLIGYFYNEIEEIRETARNELGIDHLVVASTHVHEGPDTMGIWGVNIVTSGVNPDYNDGVKGKVMDALTEATGGLVPAQVSYGHKIIEDGDAFGNGINNFNIDTRDPAVHDKNLFALRFEDAKSGATIATLINQANHPETVADENLLITADFVGNLLRTVEEGIDTPDGFLAGLGGIAIYFNGALGGLMTPLSAPGTDLWSVTPEDNSFEKADAIGGFLGAYVLQMLSAEGVRSETAPPLSFRRKVVELPVENTLYEIMFNAGVFDRPLYNYDPDQPAGEDNRAFVRTEVDVLELGPARILTIPGELLPEWAVGGYDGSMTGPLRVFIEEIDHPLPLEEAPQGPYLYEQIGAEYSLIFGLANDELGYLIPPWEYILSENSPYFEEAEGDHYEETNSLGPEAAPALMEEALMLLAWER